MRLRSYSLLAAVSAAMALAGPAAHAVELNQAVLGQIHTLLAQKASRGGAELRIDSQLLYEVERGEGALAPGVADLRTGIQVDAQDRCLVDIRATVTPELLRAIESAGGEVVDSLPRFDAVRARLPMGAVRGLAEHPQVRFIRPADQAATNKVNTSEGDVAHEAELARNRYQVDGAGLRVAVLSDGVDTLPARQATGDVGPVVRVLPGQAGAGDEGTAMLEIVTDLAPGSTYLFATAFGGQARFAQNILDLRAAGADVIVDDIFYFAEGVFQDGVIAEAVNQVTADGALYFSSAGNSGNYTAGTSGTWEGDYLDSGLTPPPPFDAPLWAAHDFGGGDPFDTITGDSPFGYVLQWSDPLAGSANDYDLFLVDPAGALVVAASLNFQNGTQDPFEFIDSGAGGPNFDDTGFHLLIAKYLPGTAQDRFLHLGTLRGRLAINTAGSVSGHNSARNAFAVAAVDVAQAGGGAFEPTDQIELFSSDGPRRVFYEADGTPITPGDFSSSGGELRQKPEIAAADGVATSTPGFNPFFGTSAAAPHAAAMAALLKQVAPRADTEFLRDSILGSAMDIEDHGVDDISGHGIFMVERAIRRALNILDGVPAAVPAATALGLGVLAALLAGFGVRSARRRRGKTFQAP